MIMNEDFVPFELAVKLKEKGYPQHICECAYIMEDDEEEENYVVGDREHIEFIPDYLQTMAAPTISQVLKWLREEKEIYIVIEPFPTMSTKNKICWGWNFKWNSDGAYIDHTFADDVSYATYEEASLTGIEYVVNNML